MREPDRPAAPLHDPVLRRLLVVQALQRAGNSGVAVVLVLFLTRPGSGGGAGVGLTPQEAAAWYGVYLSLTFLTAVPGAWLADRRLGAAGGYAAGIGLALAGQVWLAVDPRAWLAALLLMGLAGGMVKPTVITLATSAPGAQGGRQHAALTQLTAARALGTVVGALSMGVAEARFGWPGSFALCGVFSALALGLFATGWRVHRAGSPASLVGGDARDAGTAAIDPRHPSAVGLDESGMAPGVESATARDATVALALVLLLILVGHVGPGLDRFGTPTALGLSVVTVVLAVVLQRRFVSRAADGDARRRRTDFSAVLFVAGLSWVSGSVTGSVLNLFIDQHTDRAVAGFTVPTTWVQMAGPITMLAVAPILTRRGSDGRPLWVRAPRWLVYAMGVLTAAFGLVMPGALAVARGDRSGLVWPMLCLAAVALAVMLLSPSGQAIAAGIPASSSRAIALWYVALAAGIALGGLTARALPVLGFAGYFAAAGALALVGCAAALLLRPRVASAAGG